MSHRQFLLVHIFAFTALTATAQNPTYQEKVYYTCKVWGFVKYYHSEVSTCQVNWDSALVSTFPLIKNAVTNNDFNDALDTLLAFAGPMDIAITPPPAALPPELCRNLNFGWTNDPMLRADVQAALDTIQGNYRPGPNCWVEDNLYTNSYTGWLVFPHDSLMYNYDTYVNFPSEEQRVLMLFKYWNIINYFNPYNYVMDQPWDSTLSQLGLAVVNATTTDSLFLGFNLMTTQLNDIHAEGLTWSAHGPANYYSPPLVLKYAEGKYIAAKENIVGIAKGDEITAVGGLTTSQWEDSLRPFISAGDSSVFRRTMCNMILRGIFSTPVTIETIDSMGVSHTIATSYGFNMYGPWFEFRENDTLFNKKWRLWDCNVGYVHMGNLLNSDVSTMYAALQNTDAIIFDIRNYPNGTMYSIANLMFPQAEQFVMFHEPDVNYPGTFSWSYYYGGSNGNPTPYQGQVILLVNEETQSHAEFTTMLLQQMPNAIVVGSQTAGADGNVVYFNVSQDIQVGYTGLGVFYPNGDSTQRVGIVPDTIVERTQIGIRHGRDIVLEKALEIAGCVNSAGEQIDELNFNLFPNPASDQLTIEGTTTSSEQIVYEILDMTGKVVATKIGNATSGIYSMKLRIGDLTSGIYLLRITQGDSVCSKKFIKE